MTAVLRLHGDAGQLSLADASAHTIVPRSTVQDSPWPGQGWEALATAHGPLSRLLACRYRWASLQDCEDAVSAAILGFVENQILPAPPDVQRYLFQRARFKLWERWRQTRCLKHRPARLPSIPRRWSDPPLYVRRIEAWHECLFYLRALAPSQVERLVHVLDSGPGAGQSSLAAYAQATGVSVAGVKMGLQRMRRRCRQQRMQEEERQHGEPVS